MFGSRGWRLGWLARSASALPLFASALVLAPLALGLASSASAAAGGAWWHLDVGARPSVLAPGSDGEIVLSAENVGKAVADGPITLSDALPTGLHAIGISGSEPKYGGALGETVAISCSLEHLSCEAAGQIAPYDAIEVRIEVEAAAGAASGEADMLSVSGGGAPSAQIARPVIVGDASAFGVEGYELKAEAEGGGSVTQAGAHPFQVTGSILLDQEADAPPLTSPPNAGPAAPARDVVVGLPPGLIANPSAVPRCLSWQLAESVGGAEQDRCPYQSAVGVASVTFDQPGGPGTRTVATPIFNVEPEAGEPARFGFFVPIEGVPVSLTTSVRSSEDWGVDISSAEIPRDAGISSVRVTFWGVAGAATHDDARGWGCLAETRGRVDIYEACAHFEEQEPPAFVTLPTSCTSSLSSSLQADSWEAPGAFVSFPASEPLQALSGCANVPFSPTISTTTTTASASSPSGLSFDLSFSKEGLTSGTGVAQSNLEDTVVSLPEGLTIDPSAGVGLGACTEAQYAQETLDSAPGGGCPEDAKLGTVEVETPLLFTTVYGTLYLAQPYENPFKSLIAVYVVARSRAERGVIVKLAGRVSADPATGRLAVAFENDPPLQFERFNFHFREGAQAPLITPATCGSYTTTAQLTPYSAPEDPLVDTASFQVTSGSEGSACPQGVPPFAPSIRDGTLDPQAGVFSPFYVELARTDAMSEISTFSARLPEGLTADLSGVPFCPDANIERARTKTGVQEEAEPSCPSASLIGHTLVGTGVGTVLDYVPGRLYMAGPFHGDPLSVVSVTSAVVGPFDLGTIVIRFALHIDPRTARVSIDPTGSEPIPTIIDGIVTHVRNIRVSIDRPDFTLNPTSCQPAPTASTLTSPQAQTATVSTPFAPNDCQELKFKPKFTASTSGRTSRIDGASLSVKLTNPIKLGAEANIKTVRVELPKQLPSRLPTLQKACTETQFNTNPAGCPPASMIGHATAITPIIPEPLTGPAIFVSHGGAGWPSLILVLQGYGVTIDLIGTTHISPQGVTSTTFQTIPDEPVQSFQMTLPQGPYSALTALGNLCHPTTTQTTKRRITLKHHGRTRHLTRHIKQTQPTTLTMPTTFTAQNGATVRQNTKITVTDCHTALRHKTKTKQGKRKK